MPPLFNMKDKMLPGVKNIIAIASGKGGVGKSTVSANLALALHKQGFKVGLMDADVYGPSIPTILGITDKPTALENNRMAPVMRYGLKVISMGFFIGANDAVIWRGPMLHKMVQDFLGVVEWGELDYLVVDLPPGTGDIQLSLCQTIPLTGAVIVSTPQDVAWNVAQKAIVMFDKLNTPILGIIENMSRHICSHCGEAEEIFGYGGAKKAATALEIAYLGEVPLVTAIRQTADQGCPVVEADSSSKNSQYFIGIAKNLNQEVLKHISQTDPKKVPAKLSAPGEEPIQITWSDGKVSSYNSKKLRLACPCASCVNEITGEIMLKPDQIRDDVRVRLMSPVGRYAMQVVWTDGHSTGLYGFDYLRKLG